MSFLRQNNTATNASTNSPGGSNAARSERVSALLGRLSRLSIANAGQYEAVHQSPRAIEMLNAQTRASSATSRVGRATGHHNCRGVASPVNVNQHVTNPYSLPHSPTSEYSSSDVDMESEPDYDVSLEGSPLIIVTGDNKTPDAAIHPLPPIFSAQDKEDQEAFIEKTMALLRVAEAIRAWLAEQPYPAPRCVLESVRWAFTPVVLIQDTLAQEINFWWSDLPFCRPGLAHTPVEHIIPFIDHTEPVHGTFDNGRGMNSLNVELWDEWTREAIIEFQGLVMLCNNPETAPRHPPRSIPHLKIEGVTEYPQPSLWFRRRMVSRQYYESSNALLVVNPDPPSYSDEPPALHRDFSNGVANSEAQWEDEGWDGLESVTEAETESEAEFSASARASVPIDAPPWMITFTRLYGSTTERDFFSADVWWVHPNLSVFGWEEAVESDLFTFDWTEEDVSDTVPEYLQQGQSAGESDMPIFNLEIADWDEGESHSPFALIEPTPSITLMEWESRSTFNLWLLTSRELPPHVVVSVGRSV